MTKRYSATWTVAVEQARQTMGARWNREKHCCHFCATGDDGLHALICPVPTARHIIDMQLWINRCEGLLIACGAESENRQLSVRHDFCRDRHGKGVAR